MEFIKISRIMNPDKIFKLVSLRLPNFPHGGCKEKIKTFQFFF